MGVQLAIRRIIQYVSAKLHRKGQPRLTDIFGTYEKFAEVYGDGASDEARKKLSQLSDNELQAATFFQQLMRGAILSHAIILKSVQENFLMTAEEILAKTDWRDNQIIDIEYLAEDLDQEIRPAAEEAVTAAIQPYTEPKEEQDNSSQAIPPDEMPEAVMENGGPEKTPCPSTFFKVVHVPGWIKDMYHKISFPAFEQAFNHAQTCAKLSDLLVTSNL